jgi:formylglycine-generating enzyme required for sulfatase activity
LTGPSSYSHSGTGDETIPGLTPGSYTITWEAVSGWDLPDPATETETLTDGGTVTFTGTYTEQSTTGRVYVSPMPESARDATWHLDGPGGFSMDGQGIEDMFNMDAGDYTVTWNEFAGHTSPDPITETKTLVSGERINFYGTYVAQTAQMVIDPSPSSIGVPWHIDGPGGYTLDGTGYLGSTYVPVGDYTITWGAVAGWIAPPVQNFSIVLHEITRVEGFYTLDWDPTLVSVTGAKFEMGSPVTEMGRSTDETQHWVQLSDFYIYPTEISRAEYGTVIAGYDMGSEPYWPVQCDWYDAVRFCNALSTRDGLDSVYTYGPGAYPAVTWDPNANGYRLPTEAEWEYACRAGAVTAFANGEITDETCNDSALDLIGWYCGNYTSNYLMDVGGLAANAWGLHDMHGNSPEWCWDYYGTYGTGTFENPDIDPTGPATGSQRVKRGCTSDYPRYHNARDCRSAARFSGAANYDEGFRIVRNAP